jgi:hypothetical protein
LGVAARCIRPARITKESNVQYPFTYPLRREDVIIAELEGEALIGKCPASGWRILGIVLNGWCPSLHGPIQDAAAPLRDKDPLSEEITLWLYEHKKVEINFEWNRYLARARAEREEVY